MGWREAQMLPVQSIPVCFSTTLTSPDKPEWMDLESPCGTQGSWLEVVEFLIRWRSRQVCIGCCCYIRFACWRSNLIWIEKTSYCRSFGHYSYELLWSGNAADWLKEPNEGGNLVRLSVRFDSNPQESQYSKIITKTVGCKHSYRSQTN